MQKSYVQNADIASIAGIIVHEVAHDKGYNHSGSWFESDSRFRAVRQAERSVNQGTSDGFLRGQPPGDTELARVGGPGGRPFEVARPGGEVAHGVHVDSSYNYLNRIGLRGAAHSTPYAGAYNDSVRTRDRACPTGKVLVGFLRGYASNLLGQLTTICADENDVKNDTLSVGYQSWVGGAGFSGQAFERRCPPAWWSSAYAAAPARASMSFGSAVRPTRSRRAVRTTSWRSPALRRAPPSGITAWEWAPWRVCGATTTPSLTYTPYHSAGSGTWQPRMCPLGEFVVAMETRASKTVHATVTVNGVEPMCRRLGFSMQALPRR